MKVKDIVNRDLVNLTNCNQEPIHIPGSIQEHGFLLGLTTDDLKIDFCSGNSLAFTGLTHEQWLGKSAKDVFGEAKTHTLTTYLSSTDLLSAPPVEIELCGKFFTCTAIQNTGVYILEFESATAADINIADIYRQTKQFTAYLQQTTTLQSLCQLVADETRSIIGFDRVMIYRFDDDYNGEVFAESKMPGIEPFFGLHYPHTDIPAQARELFIKNHLRLISDVNYTPVPIYTIDDTTNKNLDLSLSSLRSVSPIHIQYLKNMGVGATLTISLLHEHKLWGLIACHHYSPKYLTAGTRVAAKLQGHFLASQISVRQVAEEYETAKKVNKSLDTLLTWMFSADGITLPELVQQPALLTLTNAAGIVIMVDDMIYSHGLLPPENEIREFISWLFTSVSPAGFNAVNLSKLYPHAANWCGAASGAIFHWLGTASCIIWLRPEALQEVNWAGNPDKAIVKDEKGLTPRKSFELWKEIKKCESTGWKKPELLAAANFASALQQHLNMLLQQQIRYKQKQNEELVIQNEKKEQEATKLTAANKELEQLTYIASHDLQEPLRTISNYIQVFEEDYNVLLDDNARKYLNTIKNATRRMSLLIKSLLDFSRLGLDKTFTTVNAKKIIDDVLDDLSTVIATTHTTIEITAMPDLYVYETEIRQVFQNLISNAIKFHGKNTSTVIKISAEKLGNKWQFSVKDNGIGIHPSNFDKIFDIFQRLHTSKEFEGYGIGLTFCKKIIQLHHGEIWVESSLGQGTTFYFTL